MARQRHQESFFKKVLRDNAVEGFMMDIDSIPDNKTIILEHEDGKREIVTKSLLNNFRLGVVRRCRFCGYLNCKCGAKK
ncbi:MAG: hypothetical protein GWN01_01470 [Nitrosopumilaceae archaeon]|nr:hypothetical protein [Nitrosopumilaceae archaeon]NIU86028.1 hypothetical protein [Nitrosopumilaceae archaeon]NIX60247.1 hypothetical protein [Nitrosopumilaceae archaeon]